MPICEGLFTLTITHSLPEAKHIEIWRTVKSSQAPEVIRVKLLSYQKAWTRCAYSHAITAGEGCGWVPLAFCSEASIGI